MSLAVSPTQHAISSTLTARNPITLRLRKILGTTFTDPATTPEALQTLSQIYSTPSASVATHTQNADHNAHDDDDGWSDLDSEGTTPREGPSGARRRPKRNRVACAQKPPARSREQARGRQSAFPESVRGGRSKAR
ncbi:hypothetical protein L210DRAFT_3560107 [Boletus edulis BED1]|uniref:Uncharacterized protein n=1 Tax=Boletus edulis BED1 TaxID=1328754 RepID=A0AAD4GA63_BOLED|nr:hypothetical protein L210DRAFT_3560107 [Boletus edulis BED1]